MKHSVEKVWGKIFSEKGLPKDNKYVVAFGNSEWGESFDTKEEFVKAYRDLLYRCWFQDMSVYYNGKLIRSVRNYDAKITGKLMVVGLCPSQVVYTEYIKYPYKNLEDSN
jgi:hypothetical protein